MNDFRPLPFPAHRSPPWTRDHVLGCLLLGVSLMEHEGQHRIASEIRHLAMMWYTGARRASPGGRPSMPEAPGDLPPRVRRRARHGDGQDDGAGGGDASAPAGLTGFSEDNGPATLNPPDGGEPPVRKEPPSGD